MKIRAGTALAATAMLAALAAIWVSGHALACVAWRGEDSVRTPALCGGPRGVIDIPQEDLLYHAVIDSLYRPHRFASSGEPAGVVLLQAQTVDGSEYLTMPATMSEIRQAAMPDSGDRLVQDFLRRNAPRVTMNRFWFPNVSPTLLDSATVREMLNENDSAARADPLIAGLIRALPLDSLPEVLALSRPGVNTDGSTALIFAEMFSRRSREPGHLEAAAFVIVRRSGVQWKLAAEIPIALPRGR
jgi:hypothetical protein